MSDLVFKKPFIARVDRAPPTSISMTITQSTTRSPMATHLKPIPSMSVKPHVPPLRQQFVRNSLEKTVKLPQLTTPGRGRSMTTTLDHMSPIRPNIKAGSVSVRNRGAQAVVTEARLVQLQPKITGQQFRNKTAFELSRFIDKRLTDVAKSNRNYNR